MRTYVKHVKNCNPDVVEFLPAGLPKVIQYLLEEIDKPVVASGLILDKDDVMGPKGRRICGIDHQPGNVGLLGRRRMK